MKILNALKRVEMVCIVAAFTVMVIAIFVQVLNRNFFHLGMGWIEELARYCMVAMIMLATEVGLRTGGQVAMEAVTSKLKGRVKRLCEYLVQVIVTAFGILVFFAAVPLVQSQLNSGQLSPGLRLPMVVPYSTVLVAFAIISVAQLVILVKMVLADARGKKEAD